MSVMAGIQECMQLQFTIPKDALPVGTYTLVVTNPAPAACASSESIKFVVEPPPTLTDVLPTKICQGGGTLNLVGNNFLPGAVASLTDDQTMTKTDANPTTVSDPQHATGKFFTPGGFTVGDTMDVTITNPDGCFASLPMKVQVVQGPIIFYVDPPFVYGNITTPVTVYTTGLTDTIASSQGVLLIPNVTPPPSPSPSPIDLTSATTIDPNHPKRLIIDVPPSVPPGTYDLLINQTSGCSLFYPKAITVKTDKVVLKDIIPPFGNDQQNTPVTIDATGTLFAPGARAYIAPTFGTTPLAVPLTSVVYQDTIPPGTQLTAIVPASPAKPLADGVYDVITVNPDGTIGFLQNGFTVVNTLPPVITGLSPGSLPTNCSNCTATLTGENFTNMAMVTASCSGATAMPTVGTTFTSSTSLTLNLSSVTSLAGGTVCTFRVTQGSVFADGGTLVITNPAAKIMATQSGANMNTARRAPGLVFNGPTSAAHYLYAIGGDPGAPSPSPFSSIELVKADGVNGNTVGSWLQMPIPGATASQQGKLPQPTTEAGAVSVGRFIYLVGGFDGNTSLRTVLRTEVLDPAESPQIDDADLLLDPSAGLAPGLYFYRVAALLAGGDANNPGGETLAGDEFAINVPAVANKKIQVKIAWVLGAATPGDVAKWRIYRTAANGAPGSENLVVEVDASMLTFLDAGAPFNTGKPLPFGAIANWQSPQVSPVPSPTPAPNWLNTARAGSGVTVAPSPGPASNIFFIYSGYGFDSTGANAAAQYPTTYEFTRVVLGPTGISESAWTQGTVTVVAQAGGDSSTAKGRWQIGGYSATEDVNQIVSTNRVIYFGPGQDSAGSGLGYYERGIIQADGSLKSPTNGGSATLTNQSVTAQSQYGYGPFTAVNELFVFGGIDSGGITDKIEGAALSDATGLLSNSFSAQGGGHILNTAGVAVPLYYMGASIGGAYFWMAGGSTNLTATGATNQTFWVLY
jgi:hypothetical protein